jgi:multiple sugar transport system ATP-binding protein
MATVEVRSVVKRFGSVQVLHGIDVTIEDRSFVVLLGPSGCGKSTLLRIIAGLEQVTEGEIAIGRRVVNDVEPKSRDVAMVFQNYALYPHMKVFDNMAFSLKLAKIDSATIKQKVERAADILNLTEYLERYPRQLSGGSGSALPWGAPSSATLRSSCSTNRCRISTPSSGCKCVQRSRPCTSAFDRHRSMSPMTRSRL